MRIKKKEERKRGGRTSYLCKPSHANRAHRDNIFTLLFLPSPPCLERCINRLYVNERIITNCATISSSHLPFPPLHYQSFCTFLTRTSKLSIRSYPVLLRPSPAIESNKRSRQSSIIFLIYTLTFFSLTKYLEEKNKTKGRFVICRIRTWLVG